MTRTLLAALLLTALAPALGSAQSLGASLGTPSGAAEIPSGYAAPRVAAPPGVVDPEILALRGGASDAYPVGTAGAAEPAGRAGPSFGASLGHAAAGLGMGSAVGALLGGGGSALVCQDAGVCPIISLVSAGMGGMALAPMGAALSTWGFGEVTGGTGNFFAALGGAYTGAALGVGVAAVLGHSGEMGWAFAIGPALGAVARALGAAAGYQLSSHGARRDRGPAATAMALPFVAPTEDGRGVSLGAAGTF